MRTIITLFTCLFLFHLSNAQDHLGCGIEIELSVIHGQSTELGSDSNFAQMYYPDFIYGSSNWDPNIGVDVQLFSNDSVEIEFTFDDEATLYNVDSIRWYRDGILLSPNEYYFEHYGYQGACDDAYYAITRLTTIEPGIYVLRFGNQYLFSTFDHYIHIISDEEALSVDYHYSLENQISIYPNPANQRVQIEHPNDLQADLFIMNMGGAIIRRESINHGQTQSSIDIGELAAGSYLIVIDSKSKGKIVESLLIAH